ncbi:MAG: metallophosphoesterase [Propionivibrio sp.]
MSEALNETAAPTAHGERASPRGDAAQRVPGRLVRFILRAVLILALLHVYIGWRLLPDLPGGTGAVGAGAALLTLSLLLIPWGMSARFLIARQPLSDRVTWAGVMAMGFFSSLLVATALRDIFLLLARVAQWLTANPDPLALVPLLRPTALAVPALAALVTAIGFMNARRTPRILDVDVPIKGLPSPLNDFTIVQLSDIHVGSTIKRNYVQAIVDRVNALEADLIAITGDVVDGSVAHLAPHTEPLGTLVSRHGTFFVTGNHEYYSGAEEWVAEFERIGLRVLLNRHVALEHDGARLIVAGVTDYSAHAFNAAWRSNPAAALAGAPDNAPKILLAHQPRSADAAAHAGFDLQLSGHTHGGQFWPWNHFVPLQQPYTAGLHRHAALWVYTSRGTGYWGPPKRFGAPSEITRIRLVPARG